MLKKQEPERSSPKQTLLWCFCSSKSGFGEKFHLPVYRTQWLALTDVGWSWERCPVSHHIPTQPRGSCCQPAWKGENGQQRPKKVLKNRETVLQVNTHTARMGTDLWVEELGRGNSCQCTISLWVFITSEDG